MRILADSDDEDRTAGGLRGCVVMGGNGAAADGKTKDEDWLDLGLELGFRLGLYRE